MRELTNDLMLINVAEQFMGTVKNLEDLAGQVPNLSTEQLGTGYAMIKAYEKNFDALVKAVRDEFIGQQDDDKVYLKNGRLFTESQDTDGNGNPLLHMPDGTLLKASRAQSHSFDAAMAKTVLETYGLVEAGSDKHITVQEDRITGFVEFLNAAVRDHAEIGYLSVDEVQRELAGTFVVSYTPNPHKIEALIVTGQLPSAAVDGMFTVKETYSLLVSKNPYKPKK